VASILAGFVFDKEKRHESRFAGPTLQASGPRSID
jgi:hypothetical protein